MQPLGIRPRCPIAPPRSPWFPEATPHTATSFQSGVGNGIPARCARRARLPAPPTSEGIHRDPSRRQPDRRGAGGRSLPEPLPFRPRLQDRDRNDTARLPHGTQARRGEVSDCRRAASACRDCLSVRIFLPGFLHHVVQASHGRHAKAPIGETACDEPAGSPWCTRGNNQSQRLRVADHPVRTGMWTKAATRHSGWLPFQDGRRDHSTRDSREVKRWMLRWNGRTTSCRSW